MIVVGRGWFVRAMVLVAWMVAAPVGAAVHVDIVVGVDAAGKLTATAPSTPLPVPPSWIDGLTGYAATSPLGFRSVDPAAATETPHAAAPPVTGPFPHTSVAVN